MADPNNAAPQAAPSANPEQAPATGVPAGYISIPEADWKAAQRWKEQRDGFEPYFKSASEAGFKKPEDLKRWGPSVQTLSQRGLTPEALDALFREQGADDAAPQQAQNTLDPQKLRDEIMADLRREMSQKEYEQFVAAEKKGLESLATALLDGVEVEDWQKQLLIEGIQHRALMSRQPYGDDHPLKGTFRPHDEMSLSQIRAAIEKQRAESKAAGMKAIGEAAAKTPSSPAAGKSGAQGNPSKTTPGGQRPQGRPSDEQEVARLNELRRTDPRLRSGNTVA